MTTWKEKILTPITDEKYSPIYFAVSFFLIFLFEVDGRFSMGNQHAIIKLRLPIIAESLTFVRNGEIGEAKLGCHSSVARKRYWLRVASISRKSSVTSSSTCLTSDSRRKRNSTTLLHSLRIVVDTFSTTSRSLSTIIQWQPINKMAWFVHTHSATLQLVRLRLFFSLEKMCFTLNFFG